MYRIALRERLARRRMLLPWDGDNETANSRNRTLERLWLSPNCLSDDEYVQVSLWGGEMANYKGSSEK